jgi:hypothetical protein
LLQNKGISSNEKLDNILDALENPPLSLAFEASPAFALLKNIICRERTRQKYFTDSRHFEMLKRCFYACYKNRPHIIKELAAKSDYFALLNYMISISPAFIAYTDSRIIKLISIAEKANNWQAAERLQAINDASSHSSENSDIDLASSSRTLYNTACLSQQAFSKRSHRSEHCCSIV